MPGLVRVPLPLLLPFLLLLPCRLLLLPFRLLLLPPWWSVLLLLGLLGWPSCLSNCILLKNHV